MFENENLYLGWKGVLFWWTMEKEYFTCFYFLIEKWTKYTQFITVYFLKKPLIASY